ncbi:MAG: LCP family protein [Clostridiaceae bacterium]|nr:LCP family protein [Clostridiaceae bacterium]
MNIKKAVLTVILVIFALFSCYLGYFTAKILHRPMFDTGDPGQEVEVVKKEEKKATILLMGIDNTANLTDVIMLFTIDPKNNMVNVLSVPRDTRVKIGKRFCKINEAYSIGKEEQALKTVKEVTGLPINYYVVINTSAFREVVDHLGGVKFNIPQRMYHIDPVQNLRIDLKPGEQILDGNKAEQLVRYRGYAMGDLDRIKMQQQLLFALIDQKLKLSNVTKIPDILDSISDDIKTNMSPLDILNYGNVVLNIPRENIKTHTLPGEPRTIDNISYFIPNPEKTLALIENEYIPKPPEIAEDGEEQTENSNT